MSQRAQKILTSMPKDKQAEAKKLVEGFEMPEINVGELGKKIVVAVIDYIQANVLPKIQEKNTTLAFAVAAVLDALEGALK